MTTLKKVILAVLMIGVTDGCATVRDGKSGMELEESNFPDPFGLGADRAASARSKQKLSDACLELIKSAKAQMEARSAYGEVKSSQSPAVSFRCEEGVVEVGQNGQMQLNRPGQSGIPITMNGGWAGPQYNGYPPATAPGIPFGGQGMAPYAPTGSTGNTNQPAANDGFYTDAEASQLQKLAEARVQCEVNKLITTDEVCRKIIARHINFRLEVEAKRKMEAQQTLQQMQSLTGEESKRPAHVGPVSADSDRDAGVGSGGDQSVSPAPVAHGPTPSLGRSAPRPAVVK